MGDLLAGRHALGVAGDALIRAKVANLESLLLKATLAADELAGWARNNQQDGRFVYRAIVLGEGLSDRFMRLEAAMRGMHEAARSSREAGTIREEP